MVIVYKRKGYDVLGNREVLSGWKIKNLSTFIIGKMEVVRNENNEKRGNSEILRK